MKKIMLIHNILWSHYKAIVFSELDLLIRAQGDELYVVHIAPKGGTQKNLGEPNNQLHRYNYKLLFNADYEEIGATKKSVAVWREIYLYRPDVIILPGFGEIPFWFALLAAKVLAIPPILTCDSTAMDQPAAWFKTTLKKLFVSACNAAFCYGTKSKEYLLSLGMSNSSIYTRCQAINNAEFETLWRKNLPQRQSLTAASGFKPRNIIFVGRLVPLKNLVRLINAFNDVKRNEELASDWGLIVVGDGPQHEELSKLCLESSAEDVHLVGGKNWNETPLYYSLSDVFVLPSTSEAWGLVVNEAMICGLPVLVSDRCGSAYDLVENGKNGFVFNPLDEQELADYLRFFIKNPDKISKMGERSRAIMTEYTAENAAKQMLLGINSVLEICGSI